MDYEQLYQAAVEDLAQAQHQNRVAFLEIKKLNEEIEQLKEASND
ncbi:hypothetical protein [Weissella minor]